MLWIGVFVLGRVLAMTPAGPQQVPLVDHLITSYGPNGYVLLMAGRWLLLASAMHAARWYVRL